MIRRRFRPDEIAGGKIVMLARWPRAEQCPHDLKRIETWIQKSTQGRYGWIVNNSQPDPVLHSSHIGVRFELVEDAMHFKLRWC